MKKSRTLYLGIISFVMALSLACGIITNPTFKASASSSDSYVELYSPASGREVTMQNPTYLNAVVENHSDTESGKALALDYKAGHSGSVNVAIPTSAKPNEDFKGIAFWVDVPETIDEYSFTLFLVKDDAVWQVMEMGTPLTLISHDGKVTEVSSIWKRFQLSGFKGWVMIPKEAFPDPAPETGKQYKFIFMMEDAASEGAKRTSDMKMYVGSIGYYTDVTGFMFEKAGEKAMSQNVIKEIEGYISDIELLKPKSNAQITLKNKMLVYFTNLKENFNLLTAKEKIEISNNLYNDYYDYMEDYLYGDIRKTELLMTFATMSDTHFTNTWVNERFLKALEDAKTISPDLSGVFVLGDLSNEGVSPSTPALTELDNYYDWLDGFEYLNSKSFSSVLLLL